MSARLSLVLTGIPIAVSVLVASRTIICRVPSVSPGLLDQEIAHGALLMVKDSVFSIMPVPVHSLISLASAWVAVGEGVGVGAGVGVVVGAGVSAGAGVGTGIEVGGTIGPG